jgi:ketosteroid isomerase-like protein
MTSSELRVENSEKSMIAENLRKAGNIVTVVVFAFSLCAAAQTRRAANAPVRAQQGRIMTATRQVVQFGGLERDLMNSIQKKDQDAIRRLLADDFQVWSPENEGGLGVQEWLANELSKGVAGYSVRITSARSFGNDVNVVSFTLSESLKAESAPKAYFVVDVWTKAGEDWKIASRYISPTTASAGRVKPNSKM